MKKSIYIIILFSMVLLLTACLEDRPIRDCPIRELILNDSEFPVGTAFDDISSPMSNFPIESAVRTVSYKQDLNNHMIARYKSPKQAERVFFTSFEHTFDVDNYRGPWVTPKEISYTSPIADQYHIACSPIRSEYQCRMIGQYEEYYVFFSSYLSEGGMTFGLMEDLLQ